MKRALAWLTGLVGIAALGRILARRTRSLEPAHPSAHDDPAEELRARLAAQRAGGPGSNGESKPPETLEERRARIHARAQEAIDAMREHDR